MRLDGFPDFVQEVLSILLILPGRLDEQFGFEDLRTFCRVPGEFFNRLRGFLG